MAKKKEAELNKELEKPILPVKQAQAEPIEVKISVTKFANRKMDRTNIALLGGFVFDEKRNGRTRDLEKNFTARYEEFKRR